MLPRHNKVSHEGIEKSRLMFSLTVPDRWYSPWLALNLTPRTVVYRGVCIFGLCWELALLWRPEHPSGLYYFCSGYFQSRFALCMRESIHQTVLTKNLRVRGRFLFWGYGPLRRCLRWSLSWSRLSQSFCPYRSLKKKNFHLHSPTKRN